MFIDFASCISLAMITGDSEMLQGSISSVLVDSMESNENRDVLSPEDVVGLILALLKILKFQVVTGVL